MSTVPKVRDLKFPSLAEIIRTQKKATWNTSAITSPDTDTETKTILKNCRRCHALIPVAEDAAAAAEEAVPTSENKPICQNCKAHEMLNKKALTDHNVKFLSKESELGYLSSKSPKSGGRKNKKKRKSKKTKRRRKKKKRKSKKRRKKKKKTRKKK